MSIAEEISQKFAYEYDLTYRCQSNLEGTINNMLYYGLTQEQILDILEDIYSNMESVSDYEVQA